MDDFSALSGDPSPSFQIGQWVEFPTSSTSSAIGMIGWISPRETTVFVSTGEAGNLWARHHVKAVTAATFERIQDYDPDVGAPGIIRIGRAEYAYTEIPSLHSVATYQIVVRRGGVAVIHTIDVRMNAYGRPIIDQCDCTGRGYPHCAYAEAIDRLFCRPVIAGAAANEAPF